MYHGGTVRLLTFLEKRARLGAGEDYIGMGVNQAIDYMEGYDDHFQVKGMDVYADKLPDSDIWSTKTIHIIAVYNRYVKFFLEIERVTPKRNVWKVTGVSAANKPPAKAYHIYAAIIRRYNIVLLSEEQSRGGFKIWQGLSKTRGIGVCGYNPRTKTYINTERGLPDITETHWDDDTYWCSYTKRVVNDTFPEALYDDIKSRAEFDRLNRSIEPIVLMAYKE